MPAFSGKRAAPARAASDGTRRDRSDGVIHKRPNDPVDGPAVALLRQACYRLQEGDHKGDGVGKMIRVVAAVIEKNGKYLTCQRPGNKRHGGLWEFPGGKVRDNETDLAAMRRELAEELNVHVIEVGETLFEAADPGTDFLIVFKAVRIVGEPQPLEHEALCWAAPLELIGFRMAPGDEMFIHHSLLGN
jgi:8-oxo-dGTP diphosphatase